MTNSSQATNYLENLQNYHSQFIPDLNVLYQKESFNQDPIFYPICGQQQIEDRFLSNEHQKYHHGLQKYKCDHHEDHVRNAVALAETPINSDITGFQSRTEGKSKNTTTQLLLRHGGRIEKSRFKNPKKVRAETKFPTLEKPLSELTKDMTQIHVVDIEAYVNRPPRQRQDEVKDDGKKPGKVKRPMNSFMLYRKAFQNKAKFWCSQNNHQIVSRVCGDSWPLEPNSIKEQFKKWARTERHNHQIAFPQYKFSPSKPIVGKSVPKQSVAAVAALDDSEFEACNWKKHQRNEKQGDNFTKHNTEHPCSIREQSVGTNPKKTNYKKSSNIEKQMIAPYDATRLDNMEIYHSSTRENELAPEAPGTSMEKMDVLSPSYFDKLIENIAGLCNTPDQNNHCYYKPYPNPGNMIDPCLLSLCQMTGFTPCEPTPNFSYRDLESLMRPGSIEYEGQERFRDPGLNSVEKESNDYVLCENGEWPVELKDCEELDKWLVIQ
ncbi:hypothetical protein K3495_g2689 [Podosphaera aphanis]|nr:hypothetical protein K3495_g2689 [Podosphaera aphanis]